MFLATLNTDFNGYVLFDPETLRAALDRAPVGDEDLYRLFTTTEDGDRVLSSGAMVPILGVTDGSYPVCVRESATPSPFVSLDLLASNSLFPLHITSRAFVADLAVLASWKEGLDWHAVDLPPGYYAVDLLGYRKMAGLTIVDCGYEFVATRAPELPRLTADLNKFIDLGNPERDG
jgi:hypothetical protein